MLDFKEVIIRKTTMLGAKSGDKKTEQEKEREREGGGGGKSERDNCQGK